MKRLALLVLIETDGDADELAELVSGYLTARDNPFLQDYGPDASWGGYEGPFVRSVDVRRLS